MDFHPLDLLLTAALSKTHNEQDLTQTSRDTNNNRNKNYNINQGNFDGTGNFKSTASNNLLLACDPGLMSQSGRDKTRIENNSSDSITRETETFTTNVTSDPVCVSAFGTVESQSPTRVSPISESAITDRSGTTESQSYVTKSTTTPTTNTDSDINVAHSATRSGLIPAVNQISVETSCNGNNTNYIKNNNNNKDCSVDIKNTKFQLSSLSKRHHQEQQVESQQETSQTTNKSPSLVGDPSDCSSGYPETREAEIETPDYRAAASRITEQDATKTAVIAPLQEYSVVQVPSPAPTLDSSVPTPSVALAVAPVTPRTTEGNYGASSSNKTRGISSVSSGSEHHQTGSPASSETDTATTTSTTTTSSITAKTTTTTTAGGSVITGTTTKDANKSNNVNNSSGSGEVERDPVGEAQQKLVIPEGSDPYEGGSLRGGPPLAAVAAAAGQKEGNKNSEIIAELNKEEAKQQKHQQQLVPLNKREGEEEVKREGSEEKEVLESITLASPPPPPSTSLLPTPLAQEGELKQSAPAAAVTTTTTTPTTITATTDSIGRSSSGRTDEENDDNSVSQTNEVVASRPDPGSDQIVPYCNPPSSSSSTSTSCIASTSITASFVRAPLSSTQQQPSQSSSSPLLLSSPSSSLDDSNEQPLKLSVITSPKHGLVCIAEAPPATSTVRGSDNTATATAANSFDTITVQERRTESLADTMCGPSEDKIMPNSSGETSGLATDGKNEDNTGNQDPDTTTTTTTKTTPTNAAAPTKTTATTKQPNSSVTKPTILTLSSLTNNFKAATALVATPTMSTTAMNLSQTDVKNTSSHVKKLTDPNVDDTLKKEELVAAALPSSYKNPSISTSYSQSLHESSPSQPPSISSFSSISSSSTLLPSLAHPISSPLASIPAIKRNGNTIPIIQDYLPKTSCIITNNAKSLAKTAAGINRVSLKEGPAASVSSNPHDGSEDSTSSQSSPKPDVDSPDSFVALPQTGFESNELEETTEDSNSNNGTHGGAGSACSISKISDCAFDHNISSVLERRHKSLVSENTCDMEYDRVKPSELTYFKDDTNNTLSSDFRFGSNVYRKIYGPFESGYNCTFSMQNKNIDQLLETSGSKIGSTSSEFDTDLLRCTTAIADDHSYCWSVSKTQDSESLLRDAHPCDDEISDSSSQDGIPDTQESISFLGQNTFSRSSRIQNPKTTLTMVGSEKNRKATSSATTPTKTNAFTSNSATKFLADLPRSGQEVNSKPHRFFDQRSGDDRKVSAPIPITPVKFTETNSVSLTSPKITTGGLSSRRSLQASPKVGCFRIGRFASISNIEWDENSDTSSSVGSMSLSDKQLEKFTYCRKVDFTDKKSIGEPCPKSELGVGKPHPVDDVAAKMVHILHDHDYCMRTTISPMKSELAKELLSGTKLASGSSKFSNINLQKGSTLSSNSLIYSSASSSSSSSSSSPHSASYPGSTPLITPSSSTESKSLRKSRNNSTTKFVGGTDPLQESSLAEKTEDSSKFTDPNSDATRTNESKLKITGSFQNDYVYYLNKTTRSRRRFSHEILPDKNLQARNYNDIVIPHLTDADIEALKQKRRNFLNNQTVDLPIWKSSQDPPGEVESDNRLINSVLSMENLCPDPVTENVLPELIDNTVVPDNLAANPEQYLTPEEMDILFKAVEEVESTNFTAMDEIPKGIDSYEEIGKQLSPASMLREGNPCLGDASDPKVASDKSDISTTATSQTAGNLNKQEVLTTDTNLLDLDNIPINDMNPMIGNNTDKFKGASFSCPSGSGLPPSDLSTLCANNSNSSLTDENMPSFEKFVLFNLKSDLFPEPAVTETPVSEGHAPWIVTITMFWNDLPAIMMDNQPYIRLVDIHKQILPAKDTGILKKRCQLLSLEVLNCTEFQRYFLVQYGRAYNSKSTLVISKDDAKILIGYYVNPPTRIPKGEGCEDEPVSPVKRITKTNGSLERRIKKHGRHIGSRKHKLNKHRINCEKSELEAQPPQQPHPQDEHQQGQQPSTEQLPLRPNQLKVKGVTKERLVFSSLVNGKSRLRHKKINFLNLIRGETGTASSSTSPSSPAATITAAAAAATLASATSSPSAPTLSMLDFVDSREGDHPDDAPTTAKQAKSAIDIKCKRFKSRVSASQKVNGGRVQDLTMMPVRDDTGCQEKNCKFEQCNNGRVGLLSVDDGDHEAQAGKKQRNNNNPKQFSAFSTVSSKLPPASKWKNPRNGRGLGKHNKSNHLKVKLKSRSVTTPDAVTSYEETGNKIQNLSVYHTDRVPESDKKPYMQPGKLFLSLYSAKNAKCIKCTTCAKVFSVDEFLLHQHLNPNTNSKLVVVSTAQSLRLRDDSNESHQLSWENFTVKHELFEREGLEDSRLSPLLTTAGVGVKGPVSSTTKSTAAPTAAAALGAPVTERNGSGHRGNSTYRVSSRKRKQKQFYPIENYDFKNMPGSAAHMFGQYGGKARGANGQSIGCRPSKKALMHSVSRSFPSYGLNAPSSSEGGSSLSENVVTLTNAPELLNFTALENDEYM